MGIYLSSPDTRKEVVDGQGKICRFGASAMQGWRLNMEDDHISDANFDGETSLFAVFDGHGGCEVAKYCAKHFGPELKRNHNYVQGKYEEALKETFLLMDVMLTTPEGQAELRTLKNESDGGDSFAGCTANVCLITKKEIYCANAGDSRSYLYSNRRVIELSFDHKPDNQIEKNRISKAGGFIIEGRVNGNLNLSRAIGDLEYKKNPSLKPTEQLISAYPDVIKRQLKPEDSFIIMGCDGVWEILTAEEICSIIDNRLKTPSAKLSDVMNEILDKALAPDTSMGTGCDNMSGCIIQFKH